MRAARSNARRFFMSSECPWWDISMPARAKLAQTNSMKHTT
jgi:hypothetical protein